MATILWTGNAPAIAQVNTSTVGGTIANGQVYTVTINGKAVSYTAVVGSDTNTTVATSLQALLASSAYPEFQEVVWTNPSAGVILGTAFTAGVPFTQTSSATGTGTLVTSVAAGSGPSDLGLTANYSTGALPVNGDDLYFQSSSIPALYNLSALSGVTLNSLNWDCSFTGQTGLARNNGNGYLEYRPRYLAVGATTVNIGTGLVAGGGPGGITLDLGSVAATVNVFNSGTSPIDQGFPPVRLKGTNITALTIEKGTVGVALDAGDVSTIATINMGYVNNQQSDANLTLGSGCTLTTINQDGGVLYLNSGLTTHTMRGGTATIYAGSITTLDIEGGTAYYQGTGTIGTLTVGAAGAADFSRDPRGRTVTNATVYGDLEDPNHTVTHANPPLFPNGLGGRNGATLNWGTNFHLARS